MDRDAHKQGGPQRLYNDLEALLEALDNADIFIGPREHMHAVILISKLVASNNVTSLKDEAVRPALGALLARSPEERQRFEQVFALFKPPEESPQPPPPPPNGNKPPRPPPKILAWSLVGLVLLATVAGLARLTKNRQEPETVVTQKKIIPPSGKKAAPTIIDEPDAPKAAPALKRIRDASSRFGYAPTIDELASQLELKPGFTQDGYALRLQELTGLPRRHPIPIYGNACRDGSNWARLAHALGRIETPGREKNRPDLTLKALTGNSQRVVDGIGEKVRPQIYAILDKLPKWLGGDSPRTTAALIKKVRAARSKETATGGDPPTGADPPPPLDAHLIIRAHAIAAGVTTFPDAPWLDERQPTEVAYAPSWAPIAAMMLPLALALIWFANSLAFRKTYLRRRPPHIPPLHVDLVSKAQSRIAYRADLFSDIARRLMTRMPQLTARVDISGTVAATVASGANFVTPVFESIRRVPEYLVLIERKSAGDQEARRHRALIRQLEDLIHFDVYYYRAEPSMLEPEGNKASVPIERLQAEHAAHRLLILGSGVGFLNPATFEPYEVAINLTHWARRAMLTPVPLAEWGREEFAIANELKMPLGRATPDGLLRLAELLGLEGAQDTDLIDPSGDGLARPLPDVFRLCPHAMLFDTPPSDIPIDQIIQDLRNVLDPAGFEWLCALAVYPAVQWDLTLYLGVQLPREVDGNAKKDPMYREDRVAALTQLPWLREGLMPNWLRRALIDELSQERARQVRKEIQRIIKSATRSKDNPITEKVIIDIGLEQQKDRLPPDEILDDEVMLDFLAQGKVEDLSIDRPSWLDDIIPKNWFNRIGWPEFAAGCVALVYAVTALFITPHAGHGPLVTGAWLPTVFLAVGALIALIIADHRSAYKWLRNALLRAAPFALAFAIAYAIVILGMLAQLVDDKSLEPFLSLEGRNLISRMVLPIAGIVGPVFGLLIAREVSARAWLPMWLTSGSLGWRVLIFSGKVLTLAILTFVAIELTFPSFSSPSGFFGVPPVNSGALAMTALTIFLAGWAAARWLPESLPEPALDESHAAPTWTNGALRVAATLIPIIPALLVTYHLAHTSMPLTGINAEITARAQTNDGNILALGDAHGFVHVFDMSTGTPKRMTEVPIPTEGGPVVGVSLHSTWSADADEVIAVATSKGPVGFFDKDGQKTRDVFGVKSHGAPARIALGPDGELVAVFEAENGQTIIKAPGNDNMRLPQGASGPVTAIAQAGKAGLVITTYDGGVHLLTDPFGPDPTFVKSAKQNFKADGRARQLRIAKGSDDRHTLTAIADNGAVLTGQVTPTGFKLTLNKDHTEKLKTGPIRAWQGPVDPTRGPAAETYILLVTLNGHEADVNDAAWSPDGTRIVTASADNTERVWDAASGVEIAQLRGHGDQVPSAAFSPDGRRIVTASWDGTARVWDAASGAKIAQLKGHGGAVNSAAFSPDGSRIVTASEDYTARVWDTASGTEIAQLEGHGEGVNSAAFSSDDTRIVTASSDGTARVWDATSGELLLKLEGHERAVASVAFSTNGRRIITASWDQTARVWDAESGQQLLKLSGHEGRVVSAAFSSDDTRIVTASSDGTARVWDAESGQQLSKLEGHAGRVQSAAFSPDGTRIVTGSADKTARIWIREGVDVPPSDIASEDAPDSATSAAADASKPKPDPAQPKPVDLPPAKPVAPELQLTQERLRQFAPNAKQKYIDALAQNGDEILSRYGINANALRLSHFLAQIAHESGGFTIDQESLNFETPSRIVAMFRGEKPRNINSEAEAREYVNNPQALANRVYANRFGNGPPSSGDGWRYRGRGFFQLTFREPYRIMGSKLGIDLEGNPDLATDGLIALRIAVQTWHDRTRQGRTMNDLADANKIKVITTRLNGGLNGLANRKREFQRAWAIWGDGPPPGTITSGVLERGEIGERVKKLQRLLQQKNFLATDAPPDGVFGSNTREAVARAQKANNLEPNGLVDLATWLALGGDAADFHASSDIEKDREQVKALQRLLVQKGLLPAGTPIDGVIGSQTLIAVRRFQQANNLEPTGEADDATKAALKAAPDADVTGTQPTKPNPTAVASTGKPTATLTPGTVFKDCDTCPQMVVVPAGEFLLGSPSAEPGRKKDEGPQHKVTIAKPFAVGKFEVTVEQYLACVETKSCADPVWREKGSRLNIETGSDPYYKKMGAPLTAPKNPIVGVSFNNVKQYADWLSQTTGQTYRMLAEAEWEYAARAGTTTPYSFKGGKAELGANAWHIGNSESETHPVGKKEPNAFGLYDMHGNVSEWTEDCWNVSYKGAPQDGSARTAGDCSRRVFRGGSWFSIPRILRSASRNWINLDYQDYYLGFRVARTLTPAELGDAPKKPATPIGTAARSGSGSGPDLAIALEDTAIRPGSCETALPLVTGRLVIANNGNSDANLRSAENLFRSFIKISVEGAPSVSTKPKLRTLMKPGERKAVTFSLGEGIDKTDLPRETGQSGLREVTIIVATDPFNIINESDESNNTELFRFTIDCANVKPR